MAQITSKGSPSQTLALIGLLLIIGGVGGTYQFILPGIKIDKTTLAQLTAESEGYTQDIAALRTVEIDLAKGKASLEEQGTPAKVLQSVVPSNEELPGLYIQLESLADRLSGNLGTVTYQVGTPVLEAVGQAKTPVTVSAVGTYTNLKEILRNFEVNIRPLSFSTLTFTTVSTITKPDGTQGPAPEGTMSVTAVGFVRSVDISPAYVKK